MKPEDIPAVRARMFSTAAVGKVTRTSRTTRWRNHKSKGGKFPNPVKPNERFDGYFGRDIVAYVQMLCAEAGHSPLEEGDILAALIAAETEVKQAAA